MNALIPVWIIGGPFIGLLILAFAFKGPSAMGGTAPRLSPRGRHERFEHERVDEGSGPVFDSTASGGYRAPPSAREYPSPR